MRWNLKHKLIDIHQWNPWYAWFPVRTLTSWVWLEYVQRRWQPNLYCTFECGMILTEGGYEYR